MPTRRFPLEPGGPARLLLTWDGAWQDLQVRLDGQPLFELPDGRQLRQPAEVPLTDGSVLRFQLVPGRLVSHLAVSRGGVELLPAALPEDAWVRRAVNVMFGVAMVHGLLGIIAWLFEPPMLYELGFDETSLALALLYVLMATAVEQTRSLVAMSVAAGVYVLDGVFALALHQYEAHSEAPTVGLIVRGVLLLPLLRGALAVYLTRRRGRPES